MANEEDHSVNFKCTELGLVRFPRNIEQVSVEHEMINTWLVVRRNDVVIRLPLDREACIHLAERLVDKLPLRRAEG